MQLHGLRRARIALAALLLASYLALGVAVGSYPPRGLDLAAAALFGVATPLAAFFTSLGRFPAYATLCAAVLIAGLLRRRWLPRSCLAVGLLIVAEVTSDCFKLVFHRPRPAHWLVTHETSYSFSSGHATNSLVFYGFWACVALRSTLPAPLRIALALALVALSAAIGWSRLALGAHFASDVIGGYLLGAFVLDAGLLLAPSAILSPIRPKSVISVAEKHEDALI